MEYKQRVIIKFLANDGLGADEIEEKLRTQFPEEANSLCMVQFWITEVKRCREDLQDEPRSGRPHAADLERRIQEMLDHSLFEGAQSIVETLQVSDSTALKHLRDDLGSRCFYFRWGPHLLTPELKEQRRRSAREMVPVLEAAAKDGWYHLVTRDESWFVVSYSPRRMWTVVRDEVVTKPRRDIQTAKFMFTVMWNPLGFHVIDKLVTGVRMNGESCATNTLSRFEEKTPQREELRMRSD
jgi:transposase